ncbi:MAG: protein translocase subunit SecF [Deltaproteobacteria bacterium]|nr:protein translocase subunit SecF [Deltaproteobacteria bacterium]
MQFFKKTTKYDFMGRRKTFIVASSVIVAVSILATLFIGPKFGIDFMGGTEIQVAFKNDVDSGQVRQTLNELGFPGSEVVTFGASSSEYLIRLQAISPVTKELEASSEKAVKASLQGAKMSRFSFSPGGDKLTIRLSKEVPIPDLEKAVKSAGLQLGAAMEQPKKEEASEEASEESEGEEKANNAKNCMGSTCTWPFQDKRVYEVNLKGVSERVMEGFRAKPFGNGAVKMRSEWVGPKVGKQLRVAGISSIVYALMFIMLYIAVRFDLRFAPGAVVALIHDVIITVGIFTFAQIEVTLATIAALLTIVGYSLNDTIVVFDRIRENLNKIKERELAQVINVSINQTLSRTVLTSLTTLVVVAALLAIGWKTTIRDFAIALLIGVFVGTYSSIFIASPVVVWLDKKFAKKKA